MSDPLKTCREMTSAALIDVIFSQESEDGITPLNLQDGQNPCLSGREAVHANHLALPANDSDKKTDVTCGPNGSGLSVSADLSLCLVSRLQAQLNMVGSMEYSQTWKEKTTPAGRLYLAHTASARRTSGSGYTGRPTCRASDSRGNLPPRQHDTGVPLSQMVAMAGWSTPTAQDAKNNASHSQELRNTAPLNVQAHGAIIESSNAPTGKRGALAPEFSRWLMGFPEEWDFCGAMAMQLFLKSRRRSYPRSCTCGTNNQLELEV